MALESPVFPYVPPPELSGGSAFRRPVVIVGAGPVGLTAAIDLGLRGIPVVLLEEDDRLSVGSRAICWSQRTLEIFDRLGAAAPIVDKGITWNRGKVFFRDRMVYAFDLLPEGGHRFPAFVNLQQYFVERFLVERLAQVSGSELRWRHRVVGVEPRDDRVRVDVETPDGRYALECDFLIAADGVRSAVRRLLGLEPKGQQFNDRFLITDVVMKADFPTERWFWFDPPFHRGQSALLHRQADDVWRIDLQLGAAADPEEEKKPERVIPRVRAMLGEHVPFELEWVSVYTFRCRRLERFVYGRVFFVGDSAHEVSPFGARGGNSGVQDAENLAWKLALVLRGSAPSRLLESYDEERVPAADDNIRNSTRSTDFITPKNEASRTVRDATLALAEHHAFARRLVNSGRLSVPFIARESSLATPDAEPFAGSVGPGAPCADAPLDTGSGWLLPRLGFGFTGLYFASAGEEPPSAVLERLARGPTPVRTIVVRPSGERASDGAIVDAGGLLASRYDARPGTFYLIRPDQHVAGRWRRLEPDLVEKALTRATAQEAR